MAAKPIIFYVCTFKMETGITASALNHSFVESVRPTTAAVHWGMTMKKSSFPMTCCFLERGNGESAVSLKHCARCTYSYTFSCSLLARFFVFFSLPCALPSTQSSSKQMLCFASLRSTLSCKEERVWAIPRLVAVPLECCRFILLHH